MLDWLHGGWRVAEHAGIVLCWSLCVVQPLQIASTFGLVHGYGANAFELWDASGRFFQPATLTGLWAGDASGATLQLNFTWTFSGSWDVSGGQLVGYPPAVLKHAWRDYPAILVYGAGNLPAPPFNVTLNVTAWW